MSTALFTLFIGLGLSGCGTGAGIDSLSEQTSLRQNSHFAQGLENVFLRYESASKTAALEFSFQGIQIRGLYGDVNENGIAKSHRHRDYSFQAQCRDPLCLNATIRIAKEEGPMKGTAIIHQTALEQVGIATELKPETAEPTAWSAQSEISRLLSDEPYRGTLFLKYNRSSGSRQFELKIRYLDSEMEAAVFGGIGTNSRVHLGFGATNKGPSYYDVSSTYLADVVYRADQKLLEIKFRRNVMTGQSEVGMKLRAGSNMFPKLIN